MRYFKFRRIFKKFDLKIGLDIGIRAIDFLFFIFYVFVLFEIKLKSLSWLLELLVGHV